MLKITNDDNQLTDKVNKILNNDTKNNVKKCEWENKILENKLFKEDVLQNKRVSDLIGALYSLLDRGIVLEKGVVDYRKCLAYLGKRNVKNNYTLIINDKCGDDWVYNLIDTSTRFSHRYLTFYSISEILKMPSDVARNKLGNVNLSEYEDFDTISNNLGYIEKLKHFTNCKFVLTYTDDSDEVPSSVLFDNRVIYMDLHIPKTGEHTKRLNEFNKVYGSISSVVYDLLENHVLFNKDGEYDYGCISDEGIDSFWECV